MMQQFSPNRPWSLWCLFLVVLVFVGCQPAPKQSEEDLQRRKLSLDYPREAEIILLIDQSTGMMVNDKQDLRLEAAKAFVDMLSPRNHVAVICFHHKQELLGDYQIPFIQLDSAEKRQVLRERIGSIEKVHGWKDISSAIDFTRFVYDENKNRPLLQYRAMLREKDKKYKPPRHRRYMVIVFDGERVLDLHSPEAIEFRYKDGTYEYFYQKLREAERRGWQIHSIAITDKASNHLTRSMATFTQGSFQVVKDATGLLDAYTRVAAEIDSLMPLTRHPVPLDPEQPATVTLPCCSSRLVALANWDGKKGELADEAVFLVGKKDQKVNLRAPAGNLVTSEDGSRLALQVTEAECGDYAFRGKNGALRAWGDAPFILKPPELRSGYVVGDEILLRFEVYSVQDRMALSDPEELKRFDFNCVVLQPDGSRINVPIRHAPEEDAMGARMHFFEGTYTVPGISVGPKRGKITKKERLHTKNEDFHFFFRVGYRYGGQRQVLSLDRMTRGADVPRMVFLRDQAPDQPRVTDDYCFKVKFTSDGADVTDEKFLKKCKVEVTLKHLDSNKMMRKISIFDAGVSGDEVGGDGIFTRCFKLQEEWRRRGLDIEEIPGEVSYVLTAEVPDEDGGTVTQVREGTFTMLPAEPEEAK
jgi:hypothetical protein